MAEGGFFQRCDETEKQKIEELKSNEMLQKVLKMIPASFEYKDMPEHERIGFLARKLEEIDPRLVHKDEHTGKYGGNSF